jgi:hypothetical protein
MVSIEEAAQKILADRRKTLDHSSERSRRERDERVAALREFLDLAKSKGFPVEITYEMEHREGHGRREFFNPTGVEGWIVVTQHPGEYDSFPAKGIMATSGGLLRRFTAETIRDQHVQRGSLAVSPFYKSYPCGVPGDVLLLLAQEEAHPWEVTREKLTECAAWYLSGWR